MRMRMRTWKSLLLLLLLLFGYGMDGRMNWRWDGVRNEWDVCLGYTWIDWLTRHGFWSLSFLAGLDGIRLYLLESNDKMRKSPPLISLFLSPPPCGILICGVCGIVISDFWRTVGRTERGLGHSMWIERVIVCEVRLSCEMAKWRGNEYQCQ